MVEAHFKQIGRAGIAGDVTAQIAISLIGPHHHGQRIPAHQRGQPLLDGQIAGKHRLLIDRDGVEVGRIEIGLPGRQGPGLHRQQVQNLPSPLSPVGATAHQGIEGIQPFGGFLRVRVLIQGGHLQPDGKNRGVHSFLQGWRTVGKSPRNLMLEFFARVYF